MTRVAILGRRLLLVAAVVALVTCAWWLAAQAQAGVTGLMSATYLTVDDVVATSAACVGTVVAGWLALGVVVTAVQLLAGLPIRVPVLPLGARNLVAWGVGAGLVMGAVAPAAATTGTPAPSPAATTTMSASMLGSTAGAQIDPGWVAVPRSSDSGSTGTGPTTGPAARTNTPSPTSTAPPTPEATKTPAPAASVGGSTAGSAEKAAPAAGKGTSTRPAGTVVPGATYEVVRGDSLWEIAERHLGPSASDAQIAAEWPRWYAANKSTVGSDPDLILPGQELVRPASGATGATAAGATSTGSTSP